MRGWQDNYHRDVGLKHGQARTGPKRRRMDRATWKAEQLRIMLMKSVEQAERRAQDTAIRVASAEAHEEAEVLRTASERLHDAELMQRLAEEGLVEALRVADAENRMIARFMEPVDPRGYASRNSDENQELHSTITPIILEGLDDLNNLQSAASLLNRFGELVAFVTDWTQRLAEAAPRWIGWGEVVDRIARAAQHVFGWTYRPNGLVEVVEASPIWRDIESSAKQELHRARDVAALPDI